MRVALVCIDKPDCLQIRLDNRAAHLAYIAATAVVEMAGPFLNAAGQMTGSLIILAVDTLADAQDWAQSDPYSLAGLFQSVAVTEWKKVIG